MNPMTIIAVVGGGDELDPQRIAQARELGKRLAEHGAALMTGGRGGVMEAASQGATQANGTTVGILPSRDKSGANKFLSLAIATGLGEARNAVIATAADAIIAVGGEHGTLSEIALGLKLKKLVIAINSPWAQIDGVHAVASPADAIALLERKGVLSLPPVEVHK